MRVKSFDRLNRQEKDYLIRRAEETRRELSCKATRLNREIDRLNAELRETNQRIEDAEIAIRHLRR